MISRFAQNIPTYLLLKVKRKFNKEIPILALSASVFSEVKDPIFNSGMNGFIVKPFNPNDLLYEINKVIKKV